MPMFYGCIARSNVVLVEKSFGNQNYLMVAQSVLQDLNFGMNKKTTVPQDDMFVHTVVDEGLCFLCIADKAMGRRIPYQFLEDMKNRFKSSGSLYQRSASASQLELNRDFTRVLGDCMSDFNEGKGDQLSTLQNQVGEVTGVMKQNIEKVLDRGDKLDDLVEKSDELQAGANTFKTTSKKISRKMYWQNKKMMIIIAIVVIAILTIIILAATGVI